MEMSEIAKKFANTKNLYFGHGIRSDALDVEETRRAILEQGLRTREKEIVSTACLFGIGSPTLFDEKKNELNNWKHRNAKKIMIISVPYKWCIPEFGGTAKKGQMAFFKYIVQGKEQDAKTNPDGSYFLRPEFIMGTYDADSRDFIENECYYENLTPEQQEELFADVKKKYIQAVRETNLTAEEYREVLEAFGIENPLTDEEMQKLDENRTVKKYYTESKMDFFDVEQSQIDIQEDMVALPNGVKIPRKQYEEEYGTEQGQADMVTLPNGVKIPRKQYEEEYGTEQGQVDMVTLPNGVKIPRKQYEEEYGTEQGQEDMVALPNGVKIPKKQYEEEMGTKKADKKILGKSMFADVSKAKVLPAETEKMTEDVANAQKIKKLRFRQQSGGTLTPEEIALLAEANREFTETQIRYQNQRRQRKGNGIEM